MYLMSPKYLHRWVGYYNQQVVEIYDQLLEIVENEKMQHWKHAIASKKYIDYYGLNESATIKDVIICIRFDHITHSHYNHFIADNIQHLHSI